MPHIFAMPFAQRRPERQPRRHRPAERPWTSASRTPLNEGRSVNPGDTGAGYVKLRQEEPAQRRPERQPRRHGPDRQRFSRARARSTKAGASTPATRPGCSIRTTGARCRTLNEGRSVNPGDTTSPVRGLRQAASGRTRSTKAGASTPATRPGTALRASISALCVRSTKAGASTPATPLNSAKGQYRDKPSLVHWRGSLDDDASAAISRDFGRYPVRIVRIKQSRLP